MIPHFEIKVGPAVEPKMVHIAARWTKNSEPQARVVVVNEKEFVSCGFDMIERMIIEIVGYENSN